MKITCFAAVVGVFSCSMSGAFRKSTARNPEASLSEDVGRLSQQCKNLSRVETVYCKAKSMSFFEAKPYVESAADKMVVNCTGLNRLTTTVSFSSDKKEIVEAYAKTKSCFSTSSISNPSECSFDFMDDQETADLMATAVPGTDPEVLSEAGIAELIRIAEQNIRDSETFNDLVEKIEAAGSSSQTEERLHVIEDEVEHSPVKFSGSQTAKLVSLVPFTDSQVRVVELVEQFITGVTCAQVTDILDEVGGLNDGKLKVLAKLKVNIVDGWNTPDIVKDAFTFSNDKKKAAAELEDVCPVSKNNPVFGVVKGDPVIIVVDKSGSMGAKFTLDSKEWTRNSFCNHQLADVLTGLSPQSRFNVITYSSGVSKVFPDVVQASEENIDKAIANVKNVPASGSTNSESALRAAYEMQTDPQQIYFLTDGRPNQSPESILSKIDAWDQGRKIPVNGIVFLMPGGDAVAKKFMFDLSEKTHGSFNAFEETPGGDNDNSR